MAKSLVIVESPTKEKTINKFLGTDFIVKSSMGHVKDLSKKEMGVDIENNFKPHYVTIAKQKKNLSNLKAEAKKVEAIYIATDPDREGEAIGWHIAEELQEDGKLIHRVTFNEITRSAVLEAIQHPRELDEKKYNAQQARRILDRLVGFQISPILWKTVTRGLSAGRVQSVAVRLICEREELIQAFKAEEYWSLIAHLMADGKKFDAKLIKADDKRIGSPLDKNANIISNQAEADQILKDLTNAQYVVESVTKKQQLRNPYAPFITSTLQQEASRKLGFSASWTMRTAQELYEGVEIGTEGAVGLITYMRTDSTRISNEAITQVQPYIAEKYGKEFVPDSPRFYASKKGNVQDAHEAIRPSGFDREPESIKKYLSKDQYRLYKLIWERFVACQMKSAVLDVTTVDIKANQFLFRATGSIVKFPGFMQVYLEGKDDDRAEEHEGETEGLLPDLKENQAVQLEKLEPKQHFTEPPPRYTEATLVKELEEKGIGRPSTYATIVQTITKRKYAEKVKGRFHPTDLGKVVTKLLIESFPVILDVKFTAHMEDDLDEIEDGKMDWVDALKEFYGPFKKALETAPEVILSKKQSLITATDEKCEKCGSPMVLRFGRFGSFLACSKYPECKTTKNIQSQKDKAYQKNVIPSDVELGKCPKCGSDLVVKNGRYGHFIACSNYPTCEYIKQDTTGVRCPEDGGEGEIVVRRSKRGKIFYSCNRYPKCKFASWDKPIPEKCPNCDSLYLVEKIGKDKKVTIKCPNKKCKYKRTVESDEPAVAVTS